MRPCGLMDKAPDFGSGDCRFESCHGRSLFSSNGHFIFWIWSFWLESIFFTIPIPNMHTIAVMWSMCLFLNDWQSNIKDQRRRFPSIDDQCSASWNKHSHVCFPTFIETLGTFLFTQKEITFIQLPYFQLISSHFFTSAKILIKLHKVKVWICLYWAE